MIGERERERAREGANLAEGSGKTRMAGENEEHALKVYIRKKTGEFFIRRKKSAATILNTLTVDKFYTDSGAPFGRNSYTVQSHSSSRPRPSEIVLVLRENSVNTGRGDVSIFHFHSARREQTAAIYFFPLKRVIHKY